MHASARRRAISSSENSVTPEADKNDRPIHSADTQTTHQVIGAARLTATL